jgi:hypothetical protein
MRLWVVHANERDPLSEIFWVGMQYLSLCVIKFILASRPGHKESILIPGLQAMTIVLEWYIYANPGYPQSPIGHSYRQHSCASQSIQYLAVRTVVGDIPVRCKVPLKLVPRMVNFAEILVWQGRNHQTSWWIQMPRLKFQWLAISGKSTLHRLGNKTSLAISVFAQKNRVFSLDR